jgi:ribosomal-protein-alanine N-acetyltransferase
MEPLSLAHSAGMFDLWSREEVCRHSGPAYDYAHRSIPLPARSPADSDKVIDFFVRSAAEGTRFRWALLTRADGLFVGAAGFNTLRRCSEYAYHLDPRFWGQGLMTEASLMAMAWLAGRPGCTQVEAFIDPANLASIRLATRLGLRPTGESEDGAGRYAASVGELHLAPHATPS